MWTLLPELNKSKHNTDFHEKSEALVTTSHLFGPSVTITRVKLFKGPYLNDVYKIFWFFDPLPPLVYICLIFLNPPSLADIIFGLNPPSSGTSSPAYNTSRLLCKKGKPG